MKKLALTIAIVLGLSLTSFADPNGGGMFKRGGAPEQTREGDDPAMPGLPGHGSEGNENAPLGDGLAVLTALGVATYLVEKRRKEMAKD